MEIFCMNFWKEIEHEVANITHKVDHIYLANPSVEWVIPIRNIKTNKMSLWPGLKLGKLLGKVEEKLGNTFFHGKNDNIC